MGWEFEADPARVAYAPLDTIGEDGVMPLHGARSLPVWAIR
jgi:hypothetical protein